MIDPDKILVSTYNVHIPDSWKCTKKEVKDYLDGARPQYPYCEPLQMRTTASMLREWAAHKAAYLVGFQRERTKDVDLNYPQRWWVRLLYFVVGGLALILAGVWHWLASLFCCLLLVALAGCSIVRPGTGVPLPQIQHDTIYQHTVQHDTLRVVQHLRDTVVQRDSVYVEGQTVYKERYIYKTRTAHDTVQVYRYLRDTMYVHQRDSISVPVYIDRVEKVRYTPAFTKVLAWAGGLSILAAILWLLFLYLKRKF